MEPNKLLIDQMKEAAILARWALGTILALFIVSRIVVVSIMSGWLPSWLFLNSGGHHIHHFVYGITILVGVSTWLLFFPPVKKWFAAILYGVGMCLLLDELIMWLTFDASNYYNQLSVDAIIILLCLLGITSVFRFLIRRGLDRWYEALELWILGLVIAGLIIWAITGSYEASAGTFKHLNQISPK